MRATSFTTLQSDINVTPLVDVCLVLLIIFMVVIPTMVTGVPVHLPDAAHSDALAKQPLMITMNADGTLYVGGYVMRNEQLVDALQHARAEANRPVVVRADKSLAYGEIVSVLDACRASGFDQVGLGAVKR